MPKKILVIDDEPDFRFFIKENLELSGNYKVITAKNGEEGLREIERKIPDIILLDLKMPGISGFDVLKKLKENEETRNIPVIIITGSVKTEVEKKLKRLSYNDLLYKPLKIRDLISSIDRLLSGE